tara:strand:+ start:50 stop:412 length:363 start_codon:yes stop_codon:yes gene_type:complete
MIQANELRLGNYVDAINKRHEEDYLEVESIADCSINIYFRQYNTGDLKPIPLTEEWLFKLGFAQCDNEYWYEKGVLSMNLIGTVSIQGRKFSEAIINSNAKHVHQLQNLYFTLTGEELSC